MSASSYWGPLYPPSQLYSGICRQRFFSPPPFRERQTAPSRQQSMFLWGSSLSFASIISAFAVYAINQTILRPTIAYGTTATFLSTAEKFDHRIIFGLFPWHAASILIFASMVLVVKLFLDYLLASEAGLALRALEDPEAGELVLSRIGIPPGAVKAMGLAIGNGLVG